MFSSGIVESLKKPSWWLLLLASSSWLLVWFLTLQIELNKEPVNEAIKASVQEKVLRQLKLAEAEIQTAKTELANNPKLGFSSFNDLNQPNTFIFDDTASYYWGNNDYVPHWQEIKDLPKVSFIVAKGWAFLALKDTAKLKTNFTLIRLIPLLRKFNLESHNLAPQVFWEELNGLLLSPQIAASSSFQIVDSEGKALFSFKPKNKNADSSPSLLLTIKNLMVSLALALTLAWAIQLIFTELVKKSQYRKGLVALLLLLVAFKALLVNINFPNGFIEVEALAKPLQAVQFIGPTLGDLLINLIICALGTLYVFRFFLGSRLYAKAVTLPRNLAWSIAGLCILFNYFLLYAFYLIARGLLAGVGSELDIAVSLQFNPERYLGYLTLLIAASITYMLSHTAIRFALNLLHQKLTPSLLICLLANLIALVLAQLLGLRYFIILPINLVFCLAMLVFKLPKLLAEQKEPSYLYYFLFAFLFGSIGTYALRNHILHGLWETKHRFVDDLTDKTSKVPENVIGTWLVKVKTDSTLIPSHTDSSQLNISNLTAAITQGLPYSIQRDFNTDIYLTNQAGQNLDSILPDINASYLEKTWFRNAQKLRTEGIYGIAENQSEVLSSYAVRFQLDSAKKPITVHLLLSPKIPFSGNMMPALMAAQGISLPFRATGYSYSIWQNGERTFNSGNFNYNRSFTAAYLSKEELYKSGLIINEFHHLGIVIGDETYVISSTNYPLKSLFVNLCFQFLLFSAMAMLVLLIQTWIRRQYQNLTLGTKIQLYLNGAFFLPLVLVCVLSLSVMSNTYRNDLNKAFLNSAEKIAQQLLPTLERKENLAIVGDQIDQIAQFAGQDINYYNTKGLLRRSSQSLLFDKNLVSNRLSPEAMAALLEARQDAILLPEKLGKINFKVAYIALRTRNEGRPLAVLGIPFFESNAELDHQVSDVVGTMIILFTCILILFIGLSYSASSQLVIPLRLLTRRLKRTNLAKYSPLEWNSKDEIGLLVREYNNMLKKLQISTDALSKSEKESAWREMAKQVAHEIKNPLTPMKLTLQYLEQARENNNPNLERITDKTIQTLLTQIENLNDIATSFAAFAQMPLPKQELFNLVNTVKNTVNLFRSNEEIVFETQISNEELWVQGDEKLISRIITNLILNAVQSVPESRMPTLNLALNKVSDKARFVLQDNGNGIAPEIREKIFIPNFSTKNGGTGIGLAVAKRGIEQLKGTIWFESETGVGSTFYFELPIAENLG